MLGSAACASSGQSPGRTDLDAALRQRAGHGLRPDATAPSTPPDVTLTDGLTQQEAVAIALWNSPAFEADLAELGLARADLAEAGLLRNPVLSLLFPVGPKQLEWTLQLPLEVLWQRPRRVAIARLNAQAVAERLVSRGLALVAEVRAAHVAAVGGERRVALGAANADLARRAATIADARLRAGDISDLEARAARSDAAEADAAVVALQHERDVARVALMARIGLDPPPAPLVLDEQTAPSLASCGGPEALIKDALASRPDVRAAEIAVEAAGQRARWERSRILNLIATIDANGAGREGYEMGPGIVAELPLFNRNQGQISRAAAELDRAGRTYLALRLQVGAEVRTSLIRVAQAQSALEAFHNMILPSIEIEQRQAESAYTAGEVPLLTLLDASRRLVQARRRDLEATIDLRHASVLLDQRIGRTCGS